MKKSALKKLLSIKKRFHIFALEWSDSDVAPIKVTLNGIDIEFDDLEVRACLKYWKDSPSAFSDLMAAVKSAYDKAE
ncbi:MAG: hypothetical protein PHS54_00705 [Clostridia bacterium]|nr:hypothetical protein [Clostridia bacterium]